MSEQSSNPAGSAPSGGGGFQRHPACPAVAVAAPHPAALPVLGEHVEQLTLFGWQLGRVVRRDDLGGTGGAGESPRRDPTGAVVRGDENKLGPLGVTLADLHLISDVQLERRPIGYLMRDCDDRASHARIGTA